ncbi:transcription factor WhiB [Streptomyces albidoflavus]|uniref:transcription factor WhiB n=1 Tax=Streptomyces albidoflavus TaxID=1886 RepID=UPI0033D67272
MDIMTPDKARGLRRPVLQAAVDAGSVCATTPAAHEIFFRGDRSQSALEWEAAKDAALSMCRACPARAACEELGLRNGDGLPGVDDMVRGGHTGSELAALRTADAKRIAKAVAADTEPTWNDIVRLSNRLRRQASAMPSATRTKTLQESNDALNASVRRTAAELSELKRRRRTETGWGNAA